MAPNKPKAVAGHSSKAEREADLVMGVGYLILVCESRPTTAY